MRHCKSFAKTQFLVFVRQDPSFINAQLLMSTCANVYCIIPSNIKLNKTFLNLV